MEFEWDPAKAAANELKHGVSFEEALEIFADPNRKNIDVTRDVDSEQRQKMIGKVENRLLAVIYTARNGKLRIISARRTNVKEDRTYGNRPLSF